MLFFWKYCLKKFFYDNITECVNDIYILNKQSESPIFIDYSLNGYKL